MTIVEGVGGVFLESDDAVRLAEWYRANLGIAFEEHPEGGSFYHVFRTRDVETSEVRQNPVFAINPATGPLAPGPQRGFILNLRVGDLRATLEALRAADVEVEDRLIEWEGGRHGWARDPDGNRLELYEELPLAPDSPYRSG